MKGTRKMRASFGSPVRNVIERITEHGSGVYTGVNEHPSGGDDEESGGLWTMPLSKLKD
jgi:hypothetical protein